MLHLMDHRTQRTWGAGCSLSLTAVLNLSLAVMMLGQISCTWAGAKVRAPFGRVPASQATAPVTVPGQPTVLTAADGAKVPWPDVDTLITQQKFAEALELLLRKIPDLKARKDGRNWAEALALATQLKIGLGGYETAVKYLRDQSWPEDSSSQLLVRLYYIHSLINYDGTYAYEIATREKTVSSTVLDLKAWTEAQINEEILKSFEIVLKDSEALNQPLSDFFKRYVKGGNFPAEVHPWIRDTVSAMLADYMVNTSHWRPQDANELYKIDLAGLVKIPNKTSGAKTENQSSLRLSDASLAPIVRLTANLNDLYLRHLAAGQSEAALEARYLLVETLSRIFTSAPDAALIRDELALEQGRTKSRDWWGRGQALLAQLTEADTRPAHIENALVDAAKIAADGEQNSTSKIGRMKCQAILASLKAPEFFFSVMKFDGLQRASVQISHKNVSRLYFRAYPVDLEAQLKKTNGNQLFPPSEAMRELLRAPPAVDWTVELSAPIDYRSHLTYSVPPIKKAGAYVIVASSSSSFTHEQVYSAPMTISDLVLTTQSVQKDFGQIEARVLSGASGRPVVGADVSLYRYQWNQVVQRVQNLTTDELGYAKFSRPTEATNTGANYFLVVRKNNEVVFDASPLWFQGALPSRVSQGALLFTDRSVYRPGQKIFWKAVTYRGNTQKGQLATSPKIKLDLILRDPNQQELQRQKAETNGFGSAAGEFVIPAGRPLGNWSVSVENADISSTSSVVVEEYKRPTFEAHFLDADSSLKLNTLAHLKGAAKYFFGSPVTAGSVNWKVRRQKILPWWYGFYQGRMGQNENAIVASGTTKIDENGEFKVEFRADADAREAGEANEANYTFALDADVTDAGGETRQAHRAYRLGFVTVQANLSWEENFFLSSKPIEILAVRTRLGGEPLAGPGNFTVQQLKSPAKTLLPFELPIAKSPLLVTAGDQTRPRWMQDYDWQKLLQSWDSGTVIAAASLTHDAQGRAKINLPAHTSAGAYRVTYTTHDPEGAEYKINRNFLVLDEKNQTSSLPVALMLVPEKESFEVGAKARFFLHTGLKDQVVTLEIVRGEKDKWERRQLISGKDSNWIQVPVTAADRGGFTVVATLLRDHQFIRAEQSVQVPWTDRQLHVEFATFRDRLRPGAKETLKVVVKDASGKALTAKVAKTIELLAYMYDRSLDLFAAHQPPSVAALYPVHGGSPNWSFSLGSQLAYSIAGEAPTLPADYSLQADHLAFFEAYGIGGLGRQENAYVFGGALGASERGAPQAMSMAAVGSGQLAAKSRADFSPQSDSLKDKSHSSDAAAAASAPAQPVAAVLASDAKSAPSSPPETRTNFSETAFWQPQLTLSPQGSAVIEFKAPDSVTDWTVWVHAISSDVRGGSISQQAKTVKELMVRPYLPRFLREGDQASLQVVVNNSSEQTLSGDLSFDIESIESGKSVLADFTAVNATKANQNAGLSSRKFSVGAHLSTTLDFALKAPRKIGTYQVRVTARSGNFSDGELHSLIVLPSRMHLVQSRFVTLKNADTKTVSFADLVEHKDSTLQSEKMVMTIDAQLFYGVLKALPYLLTYPYECTEQTLNRFLSTGIVTSVYKKFPAVAKMAKELSSRKTPLAPFNETDANRRLKLEESPWLNEAQGEAATAEMVNTLDEARSRDIRDQAIAKLQKDQLPSGAFPWWAGGPPDASITLYLMQGFARASEFKIAVPKDMTVRGWQYLKTYYEADLKKAMAHDTGAELVTYFSYALSSYPDTSWTGKTFSETEQKQMLDFSLKHWKEHSPRSKAYLALTLHRAHRDPEAKLVWDSVMDSAKTDADTGTSWTPEDRAWLWYRDTTETQAFALRALTELNPNDSRADGLVQWLFLNKKQNHWKSTKATAEVLYSLVHYLEHHDALGKRESVTVETGTQKAEFKFDPEHVSETKNQLVLPGELLGLPSFGKVKFTKKGPGLAFASATWHFATDQLPKTAQGDFFSVTREYFKRQVSQKDSQKEMTLIPIPNFEKAGQAGVALKVGDEVEVHLSLRLKAAAEYIHLRDPRAAGLEPESVVSGYKWDLGISWYEEVRDSANNFFFTSLPPGEYNFKYRLRANMAGVFRVGPAEIQSMYAPEFNAYSTGQILTIVPAH